jgi:hypothetical protein
MDRRGKDLRAVSRADDLLAVAMPRFGDGAASIFV